jgi:hypothetical protein
MESLVQVLSFVVRTLEDSSLSKERNRIFFLVQGNDIKHSIRDGNVCLMKYS